MFTVCVLHLTTMFFVRSNSDPIRVSTHCGLCLCACYEKCTYHTKSFSLTAIHVHTGICLFNPVLCCVNGSLQTYSLTDCLKELVTVSMCTASFCCHLAFSLCGRSLGTFGIGTCHPSIAVVLYSSIGTAQMMPPGQSPSFVLHVSTHRIKVNSSWRPIPIKSLTFSIIAIMKPTYLSILDGSLW